MQKYLNETIDLHEKYFIFSMARLIDTNEEPEKGEAEEKRMKLFELSIANNK